MSGRDHDRDKRREEEMKRVMALKIADNERRRQAMETARRLREVRLKLRQLNLLMQNLCYDLNAINASYRSSLSPSTQRERRDHIERLEHRIREAQWEINSLEDEERRLERAEFN